MGKKKVKGSQITRQQNFQHYIMQFTKPTINIIILIRKKQLLAQKRIATTVSEKKNNRK